MTVLFNHTAIVTPDAGRTVLYDSALEGTKSGNTTTLEKGQDKRLPISMNPLGSAVRFNP